MNFSSQAKGKLYFLFVFAFVLLSSFPVFELFFDIPRPILFVWAFLCCTIVLFGGFVYGILTKSRIGAVVRGFSFPFLFYNNFIINFIISDRSNLCITASFNSELLESVPSVIDRSRLKCNCLLVCNGRKRN
jgi:hypothetical protein